MDFKEVTAGPDDNNRRLDKIIRRFLPELPLSQVYKLIRKNLIKINGKKTTQEYKIQTGDIISFPAFLLIENDEKKPGETLLPLPPIVFENENILILNKPYDMLVHGDNESLDIAVSQYYNKTRQKDSLVFKTGPLHRIDRKTTGLIAFSMSIEGARWFSENIQTHTIQKKYYGIIQGNLKNKEIWKDYIRRQEDSSENFHTVEAVFFQEENAKEAYTEVTPIKHSEYKGLPITLVEFNIKTGRTHQIRSQSALHKMPLLGDTAYGGKKLQGKRAHYLQAYQLQFPENSIGLPSVIELPLDKEMLSFFLN